MRINLNYLIFLDFSVFYTIFYCITIIASQDEGITQSWLFPTFQPSGSTSPLTPASQDEGITEGWLFPTTRTRVAQAEQKSSSLLDPLSLIHTYTQDFQPSGSYLPLTPTIQDEGVAESRLFPSPRTEWRNYRQTQQTSSLLKVLILLHNDTEDFHPYGNSVLGSLLLAIESRFFSEQWNVRPVRALELN